MNPEVKTKWLSALRSGEYIQGDSRLKSVSETGRTIYCCLGVLCDLHSKETGTPWDGEDGDESYLGEDSVLPKTVMEWAELPDCNPKIRILGGRQDLAAVNDDGVPFDQIANIIEAQL